MIQNRIIPMSLFLFAFSFPIAALGADAAAPSAPAVQSAAWTTADYLRAALSGAAGGLISGFVALVIGWMNNKNALKMNQQKIDADRKIKELEHKNTIKKIKYEEMRDICTRYIACIDPLLVKEGKYNFEKSIYICSQLTLACGRRYAQYAYKIPQLIVSCNELLPSHLRAAHVDNITADKKFTQYIEFFQFFVLLTREMLEGKALPKPCEWNIDDFEGSVPLDYRRSLP